MPEEITACPNCKTELKSTFFGGISLLSQNKTKIINEYQDFKNETYCTKYGNDLLTKSKPKLAAEKQDLKNKISSILDAVPVVSTHNPFNWDYEIIDMITGLSTTGTGAISEFTSSFSDLFGIQSGRFNKKLKAGEDFCFSQLRLQAINSGGNAVIATDIDYSEVGGDKGMLMVCMAGTAVKLKNVESLGSERAEKIGQLTRFNMKLEKLNSYNPDEF